jgi:hypothetical protein
MYTGTPTNLNNTNTTPKNPFVFTNLLFVAIHFRYLKGSQNVTMILSDYNMLPSNRDLPHRQYSILRLALLSQGQSDEPFGGYCNLTSK